MAEAFIKFSMEWREVPTTCEPCSVCEDVIYGKQYQLHLERIGETDVRLCESCYMAISDADSP